MNVTTKKQHQSFSNRYVKTGCITLIIIAGLLTTLLVFTVPWPHPPLWQIEKNAKLNFPDSARVLYSHGRWFLETHIVAKIEIDKSDVDSFIKHLPSSLKASTEEQSWKYPIYFNQLWNSGVKRFKAFNYEKRTKFGNEACIVVVTLDDPKKAIVFLDYCDF